MNYKLFKAINRISGHVPPVDKLMIFLSNNIRYLFSLILLLMWFRNKQASTNAIISVILSFMVDILIRMFSYKPRPFKRDRIGILIPSKHTSTFPSKHTILVFAAATSMFIHDRVIGAIMVVLASFTGFSRIWVGHHYPSDVIGSATLGSLTSITIEKVRKHQQT